MSVQKYRKKPVVIEALIWDGNNRVEVAEFIGDSLKDFIREAEDLTKYSVWMKTLEGATCASIGDFIIKGSKGEFYPCKPDIFEDVYEKAGE